MSSQRTMVWALSAVAGLSACGGGGETSGGSVPCDAGTPSVPKDAEVSPSVDKDSGAEPPSALIQVKINGRVLDAENSSPIGQVTVSAGDAKTTTSSNGQFSLLSGSSTKELALALSQKLYAGTVLTFPSTGGAAQLFMKKLDASHKFKAEDGVSVTLPSGVELDIPPNAVVDKAGTKVKGSMTLEVAAVDGRDTKEASALPGTKTAVTRAGKRGTLSVAHALSVRITDANSKEMSVDPKSQVVALIPAHDKDTASQLAVYSFSDGSKEWSEEGSAKRGADGRYRADIEHLSWWGLGELLAKRSCVRACVEDDEGAPVAGAQVWLVGVSAPSVATFFTDQTGCGATDTAGDVEATVIAQAGDRVSNRLRLQIPEVMATAAENPGFCEDLGRLTLGGKSADACALCVAQTPEPLEDAGVSADASMNGDAGSEPPLDAGSALSDAGSALYDASLGVADAGLGAGDASVGAQDAAVTLDAGAPDSGPLSCASGFAECDDNLLTVCETSLDAVDSCGDCYTVCDTLNGTPGCLQQTCAIASCNSGYEDCDTLVETGCESNLATDPTHCGECGRDCQSAGASCSSGMCSGVSLFTAQPYGTDNSAARTWKFGANAAFHLGFNSYSLDRLPVDGGAASTVWSASAVGGTESLWVTPTQVYWAQRGAPSVVLTKLHTDAASTLPSVAFTPEYQPTFLRVENGTFYWASGDYQSGDPAGYIYSRAVSAPSNDPGTRIVTVDQGTHGAIVALTTSTDAIYWVTSGASYGIRTTPLAGGTPTDVPGGAIANGYATGNATLQAVGTTLYFNRNVDTSFTNGLYAYTPGDAQPTQLVSAEDVTSFLMDASYFYFLRQNVSGVFRAPITGGAATQITAQSGTKLVGQDATYLYLTSSTCCQTALYKIVK